MRLPEAPSKGEVAAIAIALLAVGILVFAIFG